MSVGRAETIDATPEIAGTVVDHFHLMDAMTHRTDDMSHRLVNTIITILELIHVDAHGAAIPAAHSVQEAVIVLEAVATVVHHAPLTEVDSGPVDRHHHRVYVAARGVT